MENQTPVTEKQLSTSPKGIKTSEVKRLKREGYSHAAICNKLGVTYATVIYHLNKKRKDKGTVRVSRVVDAAPVSAFEVELFGTTIKLDKQPSSIEKIGNKYVIS